MLHRIRPRSIYDVFAAIACFGVLAGGTAYAADTINSTDIVDGQVKSVDVANQDLTGGDIKDNSISSFDVASLVGDDVVNESLTNADIKNGSLTDLDVGLVAANAPVAVGVVNATSCVNKSTGITTGDAVKVHVVLTPSFNDANGGLVYDVRQAQNGFIWIHVCNFGGAQVDDGTTHFQLIGVRATQ